jgi:hypothetical protein
VNGQVGSEGVALAHPLRAMLLDLVREHGTLTSTEAARLTGRSSGLCSFHLRQLARYGYVEEAGQPRGRVRPWRLATAEPTADDDGFGALARDLEDEGYRRWLAGKPHVAPGWRQDAAFSVVLELSPAELTEAASEIRAVLDRYRGRGGRGRRPVGAVVRVFPLLPADSGG